MAHKRKQEKGSSAPRRAATLHRRRQAPAGRIGRLRESAEPRVLAQDAHSVQVRADIDAALSEALRLRADIEQRIERGLHEEPRRAPLARPPVSNAPSSGRMGRRSGRAFP
ncbi:MAG: hypothetical protein ABW123_14085 [Cystobacter sp.]